MDSFPHFLSFTPQIFNSFPQFKPAGAGLDSPALISSSPVRMCSKLGLIPSIFSSSCPNQRQLRTLPLRFLLLLSESAPTSDSFARFSLSPVRIRANFGLIPSDFSSSCPNPCQLRTHPLRFLLFLSESVPTSDSFPQISPLPVRISANFGLAISDFSFSCPNQHQLRTHSL